jgi:CheY-like chemotaxis protein
METCRTNPIEILLVEDNPGDVGLVREGLAEGKICNQLHVASDGVEAMMFLRGLEGRADALFPDLILLDLNLPRMSGREVLKEIKSDPYLKTIPVVVLTSSKEEEDISRAYGDRANCYVTKPIGFEAFLEVVRSIETFWFSVVKLPYRHPA